MNESNFPSMVGSYDVITAWPIPQIMDQSTQSQNLNSSKMVQHRGMSVVGLLVATIPRISSLRPMSSHVLNTNNNLKSDALEGLSPNAPVVILVRTFLDQNIGAAARAMLNFGLVDLRLVDPQCDHLSESSRARAAGGVIVLENSKVYGSIIEASSDLKATFATSARLRDATMKVMSPSEMSQRISTISLRDDSRCGIIFGPERSGLTNQDLTTVDGLIQIPSNPNFSSINLAQAVNICSYEYYNFMQSAALSDEEITNQYHHNNDSHLYVPGDNEIASKGDISSLLDRLEQSMDTSKEESKTPLTTNRHHKLRFIFGRLQLTKSEVRLMHGVVSSLTRHSR